MALTWTDSQDADFRDACLDWYSLLESRRDALSPARPDDGIPYQPVFIRLTGPAARSALVAAVDDPASPLMMDSHEYAELSARAGATDPLAGLPDEYALYRRMGTADSDFAHLFTVIDAGVPVSIAASARTTLIAPAAPPTGNRGAPIVAIVDDGVGFLNARFTRSLPGGSRKSRIHALWVQALESRAGAGRVLAGEVLTRDQIDALLGQEESAAYAALNARLFSGEGRQSTGFGASHGTHVLDLAAGADPHDDQDEARDWPILAVQLPPQAIEDTSGIRFESYMVQAVRWILRRAREVDASAPVIVNLSLGVLAGPKDGSRFLEYQIAREAAEWERITGQPVRVVWSFGNNFDSRLVSRVSYGTASGRKHPNRKVTWRVQPSDQTASYLEIRVPGQDMGDLQVALDAPDGTASGFVAVAPGQRRSLETGGRAIARIYHVPARELGTGVVSPGHYVLALAPTEGRKTGEPEAASGAWQVRLRHEGPEALEVTLQIQRDDGLRGYRARARQSYFDDDGAYAWDDARMNYRSYAAGCPLTHAGSHSAMVTSPARQVFCVGAARRDNTQGSTALPGISPARYTAQGANWSVAGPTVAAIADEGVFHSGLLASGTLSGSSRALGGTSAAAARLTRALALSAQWIVQQAGSGARIADLDPARLILTAVAPEAQSRLGELVVGIPSRSGDIRVASPESAAPLVG